MKKYLLWLLVIAAACAKKSEDPAVADPDAVPAGHHLIKVEYRGGGWGSGSPQPYPELYIVQSTSNTAGKRVYQSVRADWQENPDAQQGKVLRLAYRDTTFQLRFSAGVRVFPCQRQVPSPPPIAGSLTCRVYVDGRDQGSYSVVYNQCDDQEWVIDTKNLK